MPAFEDVVKRQGDLVRKMLQGAVLLGRYPTDPVINTLVSADGITVPAGYEGLGWLGEDGITFSQEEEASEVTAYGTSDFIRRDIKRQSKSLAVTALETKRLTKEVVTGQDLRNHKFSVAGELVITGSARPPTRYWRAVAIGIDGDGDQRWHMAKAYPKVSVTEGGDETWTDGDDPVQYPATLTAYMDDTAGYSWREFIFGPGAKAKAVEMGWTVLVLATGATAGTPGSFTPTGSEAPADLAQLKAEVTASPTTAWTIGQYVVLGDASEAHWSGTAWVAGRKA